MSDNATVGVDLGGVITTSGALNSEVLQSLAAFINSQGYEFQSLSKDDLPVHDDVFVTLTDDPVVVLDANSAGVNTGGFDATILGGGANTAIVAQDGSLTCYGSAGQIFATDGTGSITETGVASITAIDGTYTVIGAAGDTLLLGGLGSSVTATSYGHSTATLQGGVSYTAGNADTISASLDSTVIGAYGDVMTLGGGLRDAVVASSLGIAHATLLGGVTYTAGKSDTITATGIANSITGAQFDTFVLGGGESSIVATSGGDSAATLLGGVQYTGGDDDTILATGATTIFAGGSDLLVLGGAGSSVVATSGDEDAVTLRGGVSFRAGESDTITATAGISTVIGGFSDVYYGNAASVMFVGHGSASTVFGGSGDDTVYGLGTTFIAGTGANVFVGSSRELSTQSDGNVVSTVYGGASGTATMQTGTHGDLLYLGGSADRIVSGGGDDTIWGNAGSTGIAPTIFGTTNSDEMLVSGMRGALVIGLGNNTTLDGANTTGGLNFFANPGYGNQTFIGSASGAGDSFYIGSQEVGTSLITIQNWHAGDTLNLTAFGAADQAAAAKAFAGGSGLFTLSDGTTVSFVDTHPTHGSGGLYG